jgi:phosphoglycolate phosphatase-like HAD superfamily hydrolase
MYNAEAAAALEKLKDVDCLVFDMDGVLVDVSQVIIPSRFLGCCWVSVDGVWVDE